VPFKSKAQQGFMFTRHPKIAKKWVDKYGVSKNLPDKLNINERVKQAKMRKK